MRDFKDLKIAVAGTGYVGLSIATLLAQNHHVMAVDIIPKKVELINQRGEGVGFDCHIGCEEGLQCSGFCGYRSTDQLRLYHTAF